MSSRPYVKPESIHIFEGRAFGAAIQNFCDRVQKREKGEKPTSAAAVLQLFLVRPDQKGRRVLCRGLDRPGGLTGLDWHGSVHNVAYAASRQAFEERGSGEQVFGAPGENSCMVLLDDIRTHDRIVDGVAGLSLETSEGNYQHLYACDRVLTGEERMTIQLALVAHAKGLGLGGDAGACGPAQPHRVPGSVNYKQGRGLFVCRLAATWMFHVDGARALRADEWIRKGQELAATAPAKALPPAAATPSGLRRGRAAGAPGDKSGSGSDWAWACAQVEQAAGRESGDELASRLELELADRARTRRGKDAERYARVTIFNVRRQKGF